LPVGEHLEILNFRSKYQYQVSSVGIELPITILSGARKQVSLVAKVDTGAAFCVFQREYAEQLGLYVESGLRQTFVTATGRFQAYGHNVTLSCLNHDIESTVYFAGYHDFPRNVLGLQGWLDKARFGLVHYDRSLFLSRYDD